MSTDLVPRLPRLALTSLADYCTLAERLAGAGIFGPPAQCLAKILAGAELGFGPVASLTDIHVSEDGKVIVGAHIRAAIIRASGRYDYRVLEHADQACALEFRRRASQGWEVLGVERLTLADAQAKGMHVSRSGKEKPTWAKSPKNMLFARCMTNGYRFHCPDLSGGVNLYDADELDTAGSAEFQVGPEPSLPPASVGQVGECHPLLALFRQRGAEGELAEMLATVGAPSLELLPPELLEWARTVAELGQVGTAQVDRIAELANGRGIPFVALAERLRQRYGVDRVRMLTRPQADEVERALASPPTLPGPAA